MHRVVTWIAGLISAPSRLPAALLAVGLVLIPTLVTAQTWQYVYDEVGRLKSAIAPSGDRADYEYDAVGNIVAIRRSGASALNISEFTPQIGKGGTSVTLIGSGFSTTPASNVVKFNGVTATVTAATATQLTVTAPNTGTTGPISVTVGATTVTTREAFVYSTTVVTAPPTITSVTPTCAVPGNTVTVTGTNFDIAPGATRVELGNVIAPTTVASPTSLSLVVPLGATSNTRVVTPLGMSAASTQLFIPPTGACAEYEAPIRPVLDGATSTVNIATANKKAVALIYGTAGQAMSLQFSSLMPSVAGSSLYYTVYNTANASIASGSVTATAASIHLPVLAVTGTFSVVFTWSGTGVTGSASFQLRSNAALSTDGTVLNSSIGAGQSTRVFFTGVAGQDWTFNMSGVVLGTGGQYVNYAVRRSDGTTVTSGYCYPNGTPYCSVRWEQMTAGTHTVEFTTQPAGVAASFNVRSWASSRVGSALTIGTPVTAATTLGGQIAQYTFSGTAGQQLSVALGSLTTSVTDAQLQIVVLKPDGTQLSQATLTAALATTTVFTHAMPVLPTTGTYTVRVQPYANGALGMSTTFNGQLVVAADATLATNGTALPINLAQLGQTARVKFTGVAGQDWTFNMSGVVLGTGGQYVNYAVRRSDGTTVTSGYCYPNGTPYCSVRWEQMTAGTHTVEFTTQPAGVAASFNVRSWASSRVGSALTIGTPVTAATTLGGQIAQYTFSGTAGQQLSVALGSLTTSVTDAQLQIVVLKPDGTQLSQATLTAALATTTVFTHAMPVLPTTGTYTVRVQPYANGALGMSTTFNGQLVVAADATLATNGTALPINLAQLGQTARVKFTGVAGQDWTFNMSGVVLGTGGQYVNYAVRRSDGTTVTSGYCYPNGTPYCSVRWEQMTAGTHTVEFTTQPAGVAASFNVRSWASSRVGSALTIGTPVTAATTLGGQIAQYTFSGTAGQQLSVALGSLTTSVTDAQLQIVVLKPDGTQLSQATLTAALATTTVFTHAMPVLPTTGTYTVRVQPYANGALGMSTTFNGQLVVAADATLATNGTALPINLAQLGQTARVKFTGVAGQDWTFNMSGVVLGTGGQYVNYAVRRSDGTTVTSGYCYPNGTPYCSVRWEQMTAGTHTVEFTTQPAGVAASFNVRSWASSRVGSALTIGTPVTAATTLGGQIAQYTFSGTAGQQLSVALGSLTTSVTDAQLQIVVLKPDGTQLSQATLTAALATTTVFTHAMPVLPTTGTYTVRVQPYANGALGMSTTFNGQLVVAADATLATNGTALPINLAQLGQTARVKFTGVAGQDWTFNMSGVVLGTGGQYVNYAVRRSDGTTVTSGYCYPNGTPYCSVRWEQMTAGTHTVEFTTQPAGVAASFNVRSWASSRVGSALTIGTPVTAATTLGGQIAQYTFSGTAGQQLSVALGSLTTSVTDAQLQIVVLKPDGTQLSQATLTAALATTTVFTHAMPVLPTTGTYTVRVQPYANGALGMSTTFNGQLVVAADATLATNGTALPINLAQLGQTARVKFTGVAGQDWTFNMSGVVLGTGGQYVNYAVRRSDGTTVTSGYCYPNGTPYCSVRWEQMTAGTHTVEFTTQPAGVAASFNVRSWASSRVGSALTIGTPVTAATTLGGQIAQYTFSGTAGQLLAATFTSFNTSVPGTTLQAVIVKPDGTQFTSTTFTASQTSPVYVFDLAALPAGGTYTLRLAPYANGAIGMTTTFSGQTLVRTR